MSRIFKVVTLDYEYFDIYGDPETTILDLKTQIYEIKGTGYEPENIKLIHSGKVLQNEKCILDYADFKLMDRRLIVIPNEGAKNTKARSDSKQDTIVKTYKKPGHVVAKPKSSAVAETADVTDSTNVADWEKGTDFQNNIKFLLDLGFSEEKSKSALRLAKYDVSKAVELVLEEPLIAKSKDSNIERDPRYKDAPSFAEFMKQSQAASFKSVIMKHPDTIFQFILELHTMSPHLVSDALSNPVRLLTFASDGNPPELSQEALDKISEYRQDSKIELTVHEQEAVIRIKDMGFEFGEALEAFLVCDKDEEAALNFLLDLKKDEQNK